MGKIRILLADDHEPILSQVSALLKDEFEVVAAVNNGRDALREVQRLDPDVLVLDISMPVLDGLQAATRLKSMPVRTKVVFLTVHEDEDYIAAAFAAGASGYVIKSNVTTDLVRAIHDVLHGRSYVSKGAP